MNTFHTADADGRADPLVLATARRLAAAIGDPAALAAVLDEQVAYASLNAKLHGRQVVAEHLGTTPLARALAQANWRAVVRGDDRLQLEARVPEPFAVNDQILLVRCAAGQVVSIEQQLLLPAKAPPVSGLRLTDAIRARVDSALEDGKPMMLAHVDEDGRPVLSFRGSVRCCADDALAMWVRNASGGLVRGIARNPAVALMYRDQERKATYQFHGRARVVDDEAFRRRVYESSPQVERDHDFGRLGVAVLIELDRVEGYGGLTAAGPVDRVNLRRAG